MAIYKKLNITNEDICLEKNLNYYEFIDSQQPAIYCPDMDHKMVSSILYRVILFRGKYGEYIKYLVNDEDMKIIDGFRNNDKYHIKDLELQIRDLKEDLYVVNTCWVVRVWNKIFNREYNK